MFPKASRILGQIIFYATLPLIVVVATPYGIVNPWRGVVETVFACATFALGLLWMIEGILSRRWVTRSHLLLIPLLALAAFSYMQTLGPEGSGAATGLSAPVWNSISFDPYETRLMVLKFLSYAVILGLLLRYTNSRGRLSVLIYLVVGIGVASALFAIIRQTTQHGSPEFLFPYVRLDRGYGQFVNRNHFAFLMEMAFGLLLGLFLGVGVRRERVLIYLAAAVPVWTALILSNSRGGIISMVCQLLLTAILFGLSRRGKRKDEVAGREQGWVKRLSLSPLFRLAAGFFLLCLLVVSVVWVGGESLASRFETVTDEANAKAVDVRTGVSRANIWQGTWGLIKEHPLAGVGFGGYWIAIPKYHNASGRWSAQQAHNDYLELMAAGGVVGLLLACLFLFLLVRGAYEEFRSADPFRRAACCGAVIGLFGVASHSLVDFGLHIPVNAVICLVLITIVTVDVRAKDSRSRKGSDNVGREF